MGKKVKEYKSGDFIFAKVKGYPAWPARVQKQNGKRYLVYFYGTGETANLPPNMIFDYSENKDKFLTKTVKRRDFNDGVKQIEYDFANNVPLEEVIGVPMEVADASANDTANDSALDATMDESAADTTANDTVADDANTTQTEAAVEDSDDAGALVIDEGKTPAKGKKAKADPKAKETPKAAKTPRGKAKKEEVKEKEDEKTDEELVSRSGRKIRPKRYMDEQTEENATLPSPAPKRRRASPVGEKEKDVPKEKEKEEKSEKTFTQYNVVKQSELEGLKKPFEPAAEEDKDKENILIAYLPNSSYAGIRVFQARPKSFKNEAARLQWDKQAARNALTLKMQLERDHITPQSVATQLVMELNLTDEEKATLDKERETEEKKSRVNFLKTEMKLIELDAKIKTCLCLEKANTELCLKLLDELMGLEVKPLMLLKHPTCLETVKRMRAYVGNTPSWDLSEQDALQFSKQAHTIRKKADTTYNNMKEHFHTPEGLSFWEYFSERVLTFKKVTANLNASELLELVHEPIELSQPNAVTMRAAIDEANNLVPPLPDTPETEEDKQIKKKPAAKSKKPPTASTPSKSRRTRNKKEDSIEQDEQKEEDAEEAQNKENGKAEEKGKQDGVEEASKETPKQPDSTPTEQNEDIEMADAEKITDNEVTNDTAEKETQDTPEESQSSDKSKQKAEKSAEKSEKSSKKDKKSKDVSESEKSVKDNESEKKEKDTEKKDRKNSKDEKISNNNAKGDKIGKDIEKGGKDSEKSGKDSEKSGKDSDKSGKEKEDKSEEKVETEKSDDKEKEEPRAKRSRDSKKTEPPPKSPAKRKSKA